MNALRLTGLEELGNRLGLRQGLTAGECHPSPWSKVRTRPLDCMHEFRKGHLTSTCKALGVWILAIEAMQRTPLKKDDAAHPGTIHAPERLNAMNTAVVHLEPFLKV
jgi:hypothetical protein